MASENIIQDIHICGACRANFNDIFKFIQHKKECCPPAVNSVRHQPQKSETLCESTQFITQASADSVDLQLPGIAVSHEPYQFSNSNLGSHLEHPEVLQSSILSAEVSHVDEVPSSLAISAGLDVSQYSYAVNSQHKSSDGVAIYSCPWSSDQEIQTDSVSTTADVNIVCSELDVVSGPAENNVKSENMGYSSLGHGDHRDIATDNIAVYVVSPKSFASSVGNEARLNSETDKPPEYNEPAWTSQQVVATHDNHKSMMEVYSKMTVAGKDWVTIRSCENLDTATQLMDFYSCPPNSVNEVKLPLTTAGFYTDSELNPNSDNSTPCPEDLEVGQISASVTEPKVSQGELQPVYGSDTGSVNVSVIESVGDSNEMSVADLTCTDSHLDNKENGTVNSASEYIRENTASAPIIQPKGAIENTVVKNNRRVSVEKRERLQGVSDDLLASSPFTDTHERLGNVQFRNINQEEQVSSGGIIPTTATMLNAVPSSVAAPTLTSYKAIFSSHIGAGQRLTPTQPGPAEASIFPTASTNLSLHNVKRKPLCGKSKVSNSNSIVYRNISGSVKTKGEAAMLVQSSNTQNSTALDSERQIGHQRQVQNKNKPVKVKFPVNQAQALSNQSMKRRASSPHTVVANLDDNSFGSISVTESSSTTNSGNTEVCIVNQEQHTQEHVELNSAQNNFTIRDSRMEHNVQCLDGASDQILHIKGLTNNDATNYELSALILQKGEELKDQAQLQTLDDGSVVMMYKNGENNLIMLPSNESTSSTTQEHASLYQSTEYAADSNAKPAGMLISLDSGQYILKQDNQILEQQQPLTAKSGVFIDVIPSSDDSGNDQQQLFVHNLTGSGVTTYPSPTQVLPHSAGNTFISSKSGGTFIVSHASVSDDTSKVIKGDSANITGVKKLVLENGLPLVEREKRILKSQKRKKSNSTPAPQFQPLATGPKPPPLPPSSHISTGCDNFKKEQQEAKVAKLFKCEHENCGYSTTLFKDFQRHYRTHTGERPYKCTICDKSFNRSDKLKIHQRSHSGAKPYQCKLCDYAAREGGSLKKHMRIHTNERPFKCQICSYASRNSSQLIVHLRTHTGDSPFHCTKCSSKFKINSDLKRHMRVHTGEKPFQCDKCDYKSSNKGNLKTHMRINHSKENEIHCPTCSFVTSSKKRLQEHIKTHDIEGDLRCSQCDFSCTNPKSLRSHLSVHSAVKLHRCVFCPYTSKLSGNLKKHMQNLHKDKIRSSKHGKNFGKSSSEATGNTTKAHQGTNRENVLLPSADQIGNRKRRNFAHYRKLHNCPECGSSFMREDSLKCHMKQHNPDRSMVSFDEMQQMPHSEAFTTVRTLHPSSPSKPSGQGIQHIVDAASKLYEEHYCSEENAHISSKTTNHVLSSNPAIPDIKSNSSWITSSTHVITAEQSIDSKTFSTNVAESHKTPVDMHIQKSACHVPWQHRSYTLSPLPDKKTCQPLTHQTVQITVGKENTSSPGSSNSKLSKRHHHHQQQQHHYTGFSRDISSHSGHRNHKLEKSLPVTIPSHAKSSPAAKLTQQQQQRKGQQLPVFIQQQPLSTSNTSLDHGGVSDISFSLPQQALEGITADTPLYNIQLVPQVSGMPSDSSQVSLMTQEFLHQLSMQTVAQTPPTHIQIVLPESGQVISGADQMSASQQQIILQVQGGSDQGEIITIPLSSLNNSHTTSQVSSQMMNQITSQPVGQTDMQMYSSEISQPLGTGDMQIVYSESSAVGSDLPDQSASPLLNKVDIVASLASNLPQVQDMRGLEL